MRSAHWLGQQWGCKRDSGWEPSQCWWRPGASSVLPSILLSITSHKNSSLCPLTNSRLLLWNCTAWRTARSKMFGPSHPKWSPSPQTFICSVDDICPEVFEAFQRFFFWTCVSLERLHCHSGAEMSWVFSNWNAYFLPPAVMSLLPCWKCGQRQWCASPHWRSAPQTL